MFHNYETEKITRKASDAAENLQLGPPKIMAGKMEREFKPKLNRDPKIVL